MVFKLKTLQQSLEQEELEHKATKARLADKNKIDQSIEEANSEALKGETGSSIETKGHVQGCWNASELKHDLKIHRLDCTTNTSHHKPPAYVFFNHYYYYFFSKRWNRPCRKSAA